MFGKKENRQNKTKKIEECITSKYPHFDVGINTYGCPEIFEWGEGKVLTVGAYCSIAENVKIFLGGEHHTDWVSTYPFNQFWEEAKNIQNHPMSKGDVIIGNDVWIGYGATILSGVEIGNGAVIGAHTVVSRNVPAYAIFAGNPATFVRSRFTTDVVDQLQKIEWWTWPEEELRNCVELLMADDISAFLKYSELRCNH